MRGKPLLHPNTIPRRQEFGSQCKVLMLWKKQVLDGWFEEGFYYDYGQSKVNSYIPFHLLTSSLRSCASERSSSFALVQQRVVSP